ncbi:5-carboxymethyl-2-hydroxymuconate semialdehyde dehydrogenase, partial [Streptomyces sp. AC563]|nr:5-carboxymethyl-2-hydroxymuconate semialdehyde dehydrogenase [Streptomyces buecherae]
MSTNPTPGRPADLPTRIRHWIGGELTDSADGRTFPVSDPVSNAPYATAAAG